MLSDQVRADLITHAALIAPRASTCRAAATTLFSVAGYDRSLHAHAHLSSVLVHGNRATTTDTATALPDAWIKINGHWELAGAVR